MANTYSETISLVEESSIILRDVITMLNLTMENMENECPRDNEHDVIKAICFSNRYGSVFSAPLNMILREMQKVQKDLETASTALIKNDFDKEKGAA